MILAWTYLKYREKIAVEVLDSYVCMRHSNRPERLLALKIRLSSQLSYKVIKVICIMCRFNLLFPCINVSLLPIGMEKNSWMFNRPTESNMKRKMKIATSIWQWLENAWKNMYEPNYIPQIMKAFNIYNRECE